MNLYVIRVSSIQPCWGPPQGSFGRRGKGPLGNPLGWDESVLTDPRAGVLGTECAAPTNLELQEAIDRVPEPFQGFIPIMTTEADSVHPEHR